MLKNLERGGGTIGMFANCATLYAIALSTDCSVAAFCKVLLTKTEGYKEEVHVDPSNGGNELLSQLLEKILPIHTTFDTKNASRTAVLGHGATSPMRPPRASKRRR